MRNTFISQYVMPVYERFIFWAIQSGQLVVPRNVDPATVARADYRAPAMPWIDPKKESDAAAIDVESGFKSRHMVIRERGYDPDMVDQQLADDKFKKEEKKETVTKEPDVEKEDSTDAEED